MLRSWRQGPPSGTDVIETVVQTGSTNDDMLARAAAGAPEGSWLRADRQTGGKGRQGRAWDSPLGNLFASTLVRIQLGEPSPPTLALVAAVALHDVLAPYCAPAKAGTQPPKPDWAPAFVGAREHDLRIKWPNDILSGTAKLAGILLERAGDAVVIGFGANLAHHPQGLDRPVTSISALTGEAPDPKLVLNALADRFASWLALWRRDGLAPVVTAWLAAAHPIGTRLSTPAGEGSFDGLDPDGALRLRLVDGGLQLVHAGDVFLV